MKKRIPIIGCILVVLWMLLIFYFSSKTASDLEGSKSVALKWVVELVNGSKFNTYSPEKQNEILSHFSFYVSKTAHFLEYGILCFFCYLMLFYLKKYHLRYIISLIICSAYAITDEIHQIFSDGRTPRVQDVMIDFMGALAMILFIELVSTIIYIVRTGRKHD